MTTYVQCHTSADATMYAAVLREEGFRAAVQSATNPTIVEINAEKARDEDELSDTLFEVYSRRVAN